MTEMNLSAETLNNMDMATFGGGCFWCTEAIFQDLKGVYKVESGYANGQKENPTYEEVCTGQTGFAEVIRIYFKSEEIDYAQLLEVFWRTHDPTTLNRQGNDVGTQYRSGIYYHNQQQKEMAEKSKLAAEDAGIWENPIVTEIEPLKNYFIAEDYHQNYYNNNPYQGYCSFVIGPKIEKFRKNFKELLKD